MSNISTINCTDSLGIFLPQTCIVNDTMVSALLNTSSSPTFVRSVYCLNPPRDDNCPYGLCPNPDIAGPMVRISVYVTHLCLGILLWASRDMTKAFWAQFVSVMSILCSCLISIGRNQIARGHVSFATIITGSPLSAWLWYNAARASIWATCNKRLNNVMGPGQIVGRVVTLLTFATWLAAVACSIFAPDSFFVQVKCDQDEVVGIWVIVLGAGVAISIIGLLLVAFAKKFLLRSREFWRRRHMVTKFTLALIIPYSFWVSWTEIWGQLYGPGWNDMLSLGQLLASFAALPPLFDVGRAIVDGLLDGCGGARRRKQRPHGLSGGDDGAYVPLKQASMSGDPHYTASPTDYKGYSPAYIDVNPSPSPSRPDWKTQSTASFDSFGAGAYAAPILQYNAPPPPPPPVVPPAPLPMSVTRTDRR